MRLIEERYLSTDTVYRPMDFAQKAQFFTLDVIADIAFGNAFGYLESDSDCYSYLEKVGESLSMMMIASIFPWLVPIFHSPLLRGFIPSEKDVLGLGKIMKYVPPILRPKNMDIYLWCSIAHEAVGKRFGPDKTEKRDMLGSFVRHGLTQTEAESESLVQMYVFLLNLCSVNKFIDFVTSFAGSDTTATAIRVMMLHVITNPPVYSRLLAEITDTNISSPITDSEARGMPYLQAFIKESLRIHPPVTGSMYKDAPRGGDTLNGYFVPEGTGIGWSTFGMMHDVAFWGEDAKVFRPERWFQGTPDEIKSKEARVELVFAYGKWQCLGKEVGKIELNKVLVEVCMTLYFCMKGKK